MQIMNEKGALIRVARRAGRYTAMSPTADNSPATAISATGSAGATSCSSPVSVRVSQADAARPVPRLR